MVRSRQAFLLLRRYLVDQMSYTNDMAYKVCMAKSVTELEVLIGDKLLVTDLLFLFNVFNWVPAESGFDLTDRMAKRVKGA